MLIHLDTIDGTSLAQEPYNFTFQLSNPIRDCTSLVLKSLELPVNFPNCRDGLNTLVVQINGSQITITVPEAQYVDTASLVTAFNIAAANQITMSVSASNQVSLSATTPFTLRQTNFAAYILGFRNQFGVQSVGNSITASIAVNLSPDNYIMLSIQGVRSVTTIVTNNDRLRAAQFKVPLNAVSGVVYFTSDEVTYKQATQLDPAQVITQIGVQLLDRFGNPLYGGTTPNYDYSITFEAV